MNKTKIGKKKAPGDNRPRIIVGLPPFETVAKALAALKTGETVYLRAGTYTENCTIEKD